MRRILFQRPSTERNLLLALVFVAISTIGGCIVIDFKGYQCQPTNCIEGE